MELVRTDNEGWASTIKPEITPSIIECYGVRTKHSLTHGSVYKIGRGAPEVDIFEIQGNSGSQSLISTLQMAPLLPPGLSWLDDGAPGLYYPGENVTALSISAAE